MSPFSQGSFSIGKRGLPSYELKFNLVGLMKFKS